MLASAIPPLMPDKLATAFSNSTREFLIAFTKAPVPIAVTILPQEVAKDLKDSLMPAVADLVSFFIL